MHQRHTVIFQKCFSCHVLLFNYILPFQTTTADFKRLLLFSIINHSKDSFALQVRRWQHCFHHCKAISPQQSFLRAAAEREARPPAQRRCPSKSPISGTWGRAAATRSHRHRAVAGQAAEQRQGHLRGSSGHPGAWKSRRHAIKTAYLYT